MKKLLGLSAVATLFLLSACGQQVCVMGIGKCAIPVANGQKSLTGGKMSFTLAPATTNLVVNQTSTLTVQGGTPPYKFDKTDGDGDLITASAFGTTNTATYKAPAGAVGSGMKVRIRVTDSGAPEIKQVLVDLTVTPD